MLGRLRAGPRAQGSTDCQTAAHPGTQGSTRNPRSKPRQRSRIRLETQGATSGGAESTRGDVGLMNLQNPLRWHGRWIPDIAHGSSSISVGGLWSGTEGRRECPFIAMIPESRYVTPKERIWSVPEIVITGNTQPKKRRRPTVYFKNPVRIVQKQTPLKITDESVQRGKEIVRRYFARLSARDKREEREEKLRNIARLHQPDEITDKADFKRSVDDYMKRNCSPEYLERFGVR